MLRCPHVGDSCAAFCVELPPCGVHAMMRRTTGNFLCLVSAVELLSISKGTSFDVSVTGI